jgi:putative FmdB family regulatory protein
LAVETPECQLDAGRQGPEGDAVPTYQYSCTECGHFHEAVQSFTDDALTECPACAGRLRKVYNAVGVVFKGSGFYRTDSRADSRADNKSTDSASGSGSGTTAPEKKAATSSTEKAAGAGSGSSRAASNSAA